MRVLEGAGHRFNRAIPHDSDFARHVVVCIVGLTIAYSMYRLALTRIHTWGERFKSAFDCYLPALAKRLGYDLPDTESERREFWAELSRKFLYQELMTEGRWKRSSETDPETAMRRPSAMEPQESADAEDDDAGESDDANEEKTRNGI